MHNGRPPTHSSACIDLKPWALLFAGMLVLFLGWTSPVFSSDLLSVYQLALDSDPRFQAQKLRHEAAPEALTQAWSELLPTMEAEASYKQTEQQIVSSDVAVFGQGQTRYPTRGYTLTLTQPLWRYESIVGVQQAKHEVRGADLVFEAARQDLMLRVAEAYMNALKARDNLMFTRAEEEAVQAHFNLARGRYRNGLAPVTDYHDARARLASVQARRVEAENAVDDALVALWELTGERIEDLETLKQEALSEDGDSAEIVRLPKGEAAPAPSPLDALLVPPDPDDVDAWLEAAEDQNPALESKRQEVQVARREISRQNAGHMPRLELVGRLNRNDEGGSLFGGQSDVETWDAMVQLTVPIFEGFGVMSKVREARKLHEAAKKDLEQEERALKRETQAAFLGVKAAIQNARALRQSVVSHRIAVEAKRRGFRSGLFPSLSVLDAERDLHLARQDHAGAQYDYLLNSLRLQAAVGTLTEGDLVEANQWLE